MNVNCGNPRRMPGLRLPAEERPAGCRVWIRKATSSCTQAEGKWLLGEGPTSCSYAGVRLRLLDLLHHGRFRRALAQNRLAICIRPGSGVDRGLAQGELLGLR